MSFSASGSVFDEDLSAAVEGFSSGSQHLLLSNAGVLKALIRWLADAGMCVHILAIGHNRPTGHWWLLAGF